MGVNSLLTPTLTHFQDHFRFSRSLPIFKAVLKKRTSDMNVNLLLPLFDEASPLLVEELVLELRLGLGLGLGLGFRVRVRV
jgi:hypothetical protein